MRACCINAHMLTKAITMHACCINAHMLTKAISTRRTYSFTPRRHDVVKCPFDDAKDVNGISER